MSYDVLPTEMLQKIFSFTTCSDQKNIGLVCRRWAATVEPIFLARTCLNVCTTYTKFVNNQFVRSLATRSINKELLINSSRKYTCLGLVLINDPFEKSVQEILDLCGDKFSVQRLYLEAALGEEMEELLLKWQNHLTVLNFKVNHKGMSRRESSTIFLPKLKQITWNEGGSTISVLEESIMCNIIFHVPELVKVKIECYSSFLYFEVEEKMSLAQENDYNLFLSVLQLKSCSKLHHVEISDMCELSQEIVDHSETILKNLKSLTLAKCSSRNVEMICQKCLNLEELIVEEPDNSKGVMTFQISTTLSHSLKKLVLNNLAYGFNNEVAVFTELRSIQLIKMNDAYNWNNISLNAPKLETLEISLAHYNRLKIIHKDQIRTMVVDLNIWDENDHTPPPTNINELVLRERENNLIQRYLEYFSNLRRLTVYNSLLELDDGFVARNPDLEYLSAHESVMWLSDFRRLMHLKSLTLCHCTLLSRQCDVLKLPELEYFRVHQVKVQHCKWHIQWNDFPIDLSDSQLPAVIKVQENFSSLNSQLKECNCTKIKRKSAWHAWHTPDSYKSYLFLNYSNGIQHQLYRRDCTELEAEKMSYDVLPTEMLQTIFSYTTWSDQKNIGLVCRRWAAAVEPIFLARTCLKFPEIDKALSGIINSSRKYTGLSLNFEIFKEEEVKKVLNLCEETFSVQRLYLEVKPETDIVDLLLKWQDNLTVLHYQKKHLTPAKYPQSFVIWLPKLKQMTWLVSFNSQRGPGSNNVILHVPELVKVTIKCDGSFEEAKVEEQLSQALANNLNLFLPFLQLNSCSKLQHLEIMSMNEIDQRVINHSAAVLQNLKSLSFVACALGVIKMICEKCLNLEELIVDRLYENSGYTFQALTTVSRSLKKLVLQNSTGFIIDEVAIFTELRSIHLSHLNYRSGGRNITLITPKLTTFEISQSDYSLFNIVHTDEIRSMVVHLDSRYALETTPPPPTNINELELYEERSKYNRIQLYLQHFSNLKRLTVHNCDLELDEEFAARNPDLEHLSAHKCSVQLSDLKRFHHLKSLILCDCTLLSEQHDVLKLPTLENVRVHLVHVTGDSELFIQWDLFPIYVTDSQQVVKKMEYSGRFSSLYSQQEKKCNCEKQTDW